MGERPVPGGSARVPGVPEARQVGAPAGERPADGQPLRLSVPLPAPGAEFAVEWHLVDTSSEA
jgi:hypothetical protein